MATSTSAPDPYRTLGVSPAASDDELRTAYRRLVQLHHPDHNNGSHESALRFAEVQEAYAHVKLMRKQAGAGQGAGAGRGSAAGSGTGTAPGAASGGDPEFEARLAAMERELRTAREQREHAAREAAREAARAAQRANRRVRKPGMNGAEDDRATDEELGYISTDDSFSKILDDFADQVSARFSEVHPPPGDTAGRQARPEGTGQDEPRRPRSVTDWIDELGSRLTGERRPKNED